MLKKHKFELVFVFIISSIFELRKDMKMPYLEIFQGDPITPPATDNLCLQPIGNKKF